MTSGWVSPPGFPSPWLPLALAVGMRTFLGVVVGHRLGGSPVQWAAALAAGIVITAVGAVLNIA